MLTHRLDTDVVVGSAQNGKLSALRSGHFLRFGLRLLRCDSGAESGHRAYGNAHALRGVVAQAVRDPDVGCGKYLSLGRKVQLEVRLEHTNNDRCRCLWSGHRHRASDNGGISAIPTLKVLVAQDCVRRQPRWRRSLLLRARRRGRIRDGVVIVEIAAVSDASAEEAEEVDRYHRRVGLLGRAVLALQRERKSENPGKIIEDGLGAFAQIDEVGIRKWEIADVAFAQIAACHHQAVGIAVRQRPQQHRVGHTEDGSAGSNSQRNG